MNMQDTGSGGAPVPESSRDEALTLLKEARFDEAEALLEELGFAHPDDPFVPANWGAALLSRQEFGRAEEKLIRALDLDPGYAPAFKNLLALYRHQDRPMDFLAAYRRQRPFLKLDDCPELDRQVWSMSEKWAGATDPALRRALALTLFDQDHLAARPFLEEIWSGPDREAETALAVALCRLYNPGPPPDLEEFRPFLTPRDFSELESGPSGNLSPTIVEHWDLLACVVCGGKIEPPQNDKPLSCRDCGRTFDVVEGTPVFLAKPLESYQDIEPEYQKTFKEADRILTEPHLKPGWRFANQLVRPPQSGGATNYERLNARYYRQAHWLFLLDFFRKYLPRLAPPAQVLDIGCSHGGDVYALSRLFPEHNYFGVEIVLDGAALAQKYHGRQRNQFFCADASSRLPFADQTFDLIISTNAIEHCRGAMMDEVHRLLKPGGRACIAGPSQESYIFNSHQSVTAYVNIVNAQAKFETHGLSPDEYRELFARFKIVRHESDGIFFRYVLNPQTINQLTPAAAEHMYHLFCDRIGRALDEDESARWLNYIQMFVLEKSV